MSEPLTIQCDVHGTTVACVVCCHLAVHQSAPAGVVEISDDPDDLQAWCDECEHLYLTEGQRTDRFNAFCDIKLVCTGCYAEIKERNTIRRDTRDEGPATYRCSCCGEVHDGLSDVTFEAPYYYYSVPEAERTSRCDLSSDFCSIDGRDFFIRGVLPVRVLGTEGEFMWGVWMSVSEANFRKYEAVYDEDRRAHLAPFAGWLSNQIPGYPDTLRLVVAASLQDGGHRPRLELEPVNHPLVREQQTGVGRGQIRRIIERALHPSDSAA